MVALSSFGRGSRGIRAGVVALMVAMGLPSVVHAQSAADTKAAIVAGDKATKAKDWTAAVTAYSSARAADPSIEALDGLANALYERGDHGRAYETYEELIRTHVAKLSKDKRKNAETRLKELGQKSGQLVVTLEGEGEAFLDGTPLGKVPFTKPPRVNVGEHKLRIQKPGHLPFETTVAVAANSTATVEAKLVVEVLKGKLRVREGDAKAVHVFVDGIDMGAAPWEGELTVGAHEVVVRGPHLLSAPEKVQIEKDKAQDLELRASSTWAQLKVSVDGSPTAQIFLDGKPVGNGTFSAEVPAGSHKLVVTREGYQRFEDEIVLAEKETVSRAVVLTLSDVVKTGGEEKVARRLEGFYGGFGFLGLIVPAGNGNDVQQTCSKRPATVTDCSSGMGSGGGLFFYAGHHWEPVGLELLGGGTFDQQSATVTYSGSNLGVGGGLGPDPARTEKFFIGRAGGFLAARTRLSFQSSGVRGSFAVGVGASYRVSFLTRDTDAPPLKDVFASDAVGSLSPLLTLDGSVAPRLGERLSLPIGIMMLAESPNAKIFGDQIPRTAPDGKRQLAPGVGLTTPSYQLATGPQVYLGLHVGLMFGP